MPRNLTNSGGINTHELRNTHSIAPDEEVTGMLITDEDPGILRLFVQDAPVQDSPVKELASLGQEEREISAALKETPELASSNQQNSKSPAAPSVATRVPLKTSGKKRKSTYALNSPSPAPSPRRAKTPKEYASLERQLREVQLKARTLKSKKTPNSAPRIIYVRGDKAHDLGTRYDNKLFGLTPAELNAAWDSPSEYQPEQKPHFHMGHLPQGKYEMGRYEPLNQELQAMKKKKEQVLTQPHEPKPQEERRFNPKKPLLFLAM